MKKHKSGELGRREFMGAAAASALLASSPKVFSSLAATPQRPNVVFILADDLGWGDLSIYGRKDYRTPNLDRLAKQGARFTNAYSAAPVCSPTRVGFYTGRYPGRVPEGLVEPFSNLSEVGDRIGLSPERPTVASLLKANGYDTALIGKWHVGYPPTYGPWKSGFNHFFGQLSGALDYFRHVDYTGEPDLWEGEVKNGRVSYNRVDRKGYVTDLYTQAAVKYIRQEHNQPFFLSLFYNAPHWPFEGPNDQALSNSLKGKDSVENWINAGTPETYAALVRRLDEGVGQVLKALDDAGIADNTLVIFASDNGGEKFSNFGPFQGKKGGLFEGGLRVPTIARWNKVIPANKVSDQVVTTLDISATILAATNTRPDPKYPLDGQSFLPVLRGEATYPRTVFWRTKGYPSNILQGAVRSGKWKYLKLGDDEYLFNLAADQGEKNDLKTENLKLFQQLRVQFQQWNSQLVQYAS